MRFLLSLIAALSLLAAGCGAEAGERASASTDANALLRSTFANLGELRSATVDLKLGVEGRQVARVQGPFERAEQGRLPKFAFTLSAAGNNASSGATWTGERGFAVVNGTAY